MTPLPPVNPTDVEALMKGPNPPRLLDVRQPAEFTADLGHIEGAELVPLGTLPAGLDKFTGETREIICICRSGARSQQAAHFLAQNGHKTRNLTGGMIAWNAANLPVSRTPPK